MRVLVTGATGCLGLALSESLSKRTRHALFRSDRRATRGPGRFVACDLGSSAAVNRLVATARPDAVYHLAGSFLPDYESNYVSNVVAARNLFEAVRAHAPSCRVVVIGSAAEYGKVRRNPVKESFPLEPVSSYGLTKMMQTRLAEFYVRAHAMDIVIARLFNLIGPGASDRLFVGRVAAQIAEYKKQGSGRITVGSLDAFRDYMTVGEAATALQRIMGHGERGETYNVGSGRPTQMRSLLASMLASHRIPMSVVDENSVPGGRTDVARIYADTSKLRALGARARG